MQVALSHTQAWYCLLLRYCSNHPTLVPFVLVIVARQFARCYLLVCFCHHLPKNLEPDGLKNGYSMQWQFSPLIAEVSMQRSLARHIRRMVHTSTTTCMRRVHAVEGHTCHLTSGYACIRHLFSIRNRVIRKPGCYVQENNRAFRGSWSGPCVGPGRFQ